ncbi:MAG: peptidylprolyl isomerase [Clostridia bacterium]|nr:peptidylprolyl isomerase [Clostridia bacterium]
MKKVFALAAMLLMLVLVLSGCNLIGHDDALDAAQVVATVNGKEITKGEWKTYRDYMANYTQQYYQQYYGITMPLTDADIEAYGEPALEQLVKSAVIDQKTEELGITPLTDEEKKEVETYADSMMEWYKMMMRYQNHADIETVEEEAERLAREAEATPSEATPAEAQYTPEKKATVTDAELDAMLTEELTAVGYTREYLIESRTAEVVDEKLHEYVNKDVSVSDDEVKAEFDKKAAEQKESYDANKPAYLTAVNNGTDTYYVPEGYRGVKNLLIGLSTEDSAAINEIQSAIDTARTAVTTAQSQLDKLKEEDPSDFDEETLSTYNEQVDSLQATITENQGTVDTKTAELEEVRKKAFESAKVKAEEALARVKAGEDFDALIEELGTDSGMKSEPNKSRGYLVCEGLTTYEQAFQDAAMALAAVGDVSDLVETSYGYHILKYAGDIESGVVEYTDEVKEKIHSTLLEAAQSAAYTAAVEQWVSDADVKTNNKVMK